MSSPPFTLDGHADLDEVAKELESAIADPRQARWIVGFLAAVFLRKVEGHAKPETELWMALNGMKQAAAEDYT